MYVYMSFIPSVKHKRYFEKCLKWPEFFKNICSFVIHRIKKVIQVWKNTRVSKWWQNFLQGWTTPLMLVWSVKSLFVQSVPLRWRFLSMTNSHQSLSTSCLPHHKRLSSLSFYLSHTIYMATKPPDSTKWMGNNVKGKNDSLAWFESLLPRRSLSAPGIS